ncbi:MAG: PIG-L family deacetylase [Lachnospiraceae bacterium]|jgi:LmbE family N-acetylglucosaminyl deacetylase|nr:PIG-L family deacetylase [Lachnospiraceae bacterium]
MMEEKRVLVVAAHPDDEVLGCGGTVRKWSNSGAHVFALILAQGMAARGGEGGEALQASIEALRTQAKAASALAGYKDITFENLPDNRLDSVDLLDIAQIVEHYIDKYRPQVVLTHHHGDLNIDHRLCFQAVLTACRPQPGSAVREVYTFETPSATEWNFPYYKNGFSANYFVDISETLEAKLEAVACYTTEVRPSPHPRSLEALRAIASRWGSVAGLAYAEAFEQIYRRG